MTTKILYLFSILLLSFNGSPINAQQEKQVKNVIMLIPDGTSSSILSLSRWYKYGICPEDECWLNIDPYISGFVKTHSSDAPTGDSAPTGSTYATGHLSHTGFIATYPPSAGKAKDLVNVDPTMAYQPMFTILEAAKLDQKSTGLVVTCQFPHATPAAFSSHTPYRDKYYSIAKQMVYNNLNVVFGGGTKYLSPLKRDDKEDLVAVLKSKNYNYVTTKKGFNGLSSSDSLVWGLFADDALPNDLDTNKDSIPSISEMTDKAIQILSQNKKGFFLMVEGSKVDWSAHNNDPVGMVTEFLAFDEAVKVAIDFAKKDGNTAVVICPDHGNSGMSIGNARMASGYDTVTVASLVKPLRDCKLTADGLASLIKPLTSDMDILKAFKENANITLNPQELETIKTAMKAGGLSRTIAKTITSRTYIGFTTNGHTAEDVMLANYHPHNYRLGGVVQNSTVNAYMREISGNKNLDSLTREKYCIDSVALKGLFWEIQDRYTGTALDSSHYGTLIIKKDSKSRKRAEIKAYTDYITLLDGKNEVKKVALNGLAINTYLQEPKNKRKLTLNRFYIPKSTGKLVEELL